MLVVILRKFLDEPPDKSKKGEVITSTERERGTRGEEEGELGEAVTGGSRRRRMRGRWEIGDTSSRLVNTKLIRSP